jgi:fumarate reductase subunit D
MTKLLLTKRWLKTGLVLSVLAPVAAFAQIGGINPQQPVQGSGVQINQILSTVINWLTGLLILLAVVFIIWAAFIYLTAGGDTEKVGKANKMLIYAAVAIAIALLAQGIVYIVAQLATNAQVSVSQDSLF